MTDGRMDMGHACPPCLRALGQARPERFPTLVEYELAKERYPEPMWGSDSEFERAEIRTLPESHAQGMIQRSELAASEVWRALANIGDTLNDAYTQIEDIPTDEIGEQTRQRIFDVLEKEREKAWAVAHRCKAAFIPVAT